VGERRASGLGVVSDHAERMRAHHVAPEVSECLRVAAVMERLAEAMANDTHEFWPDDLHFGDELVDRHHAVPIDIAGHLSAAFTCGAKPTPKLIINIPNSLIRGISISCAARRLRLSADGFV